MTKAPTLPGVEIPNYRRRVASWRMCQCADPSLEEIKTNGGELIGILCRRCTRPGSLKCRQCGTWFRDLNHHLSEDNPCAKREKEIAKASAKRIR